MGNSSSLSPGRADRKGRRKGAQESKSPQADKSRTPSQSSQPTASHTPLRDDGDLADQYPDEAADVGGTMADMLSYSIFGAPKPAVYYQDEVFDAVERGDVFALGVMNKQKVSLAE
jgi:hypothetical protein